MSAIDFHTVDGQATDVAARPPIALPMAAWALNLFGVWPVAVVIAYLERGKAPPEVAAQYQYLIRTVWIGALFFAVSYVLCLVAVGLILMLPVGLILMLATMIWYVARCVKAMLALSRREPLRNPRTWLV